MYLAFSIYIVQIEFKEYAYSKKYHLHGVIIGGVCLIE